MSFPTRFFYLASAGVPPSFATSPWHLSALLPAALAQLLCALGLNACGGGGSSPSAAPTTYTANCSDGSTKTSTVSQAAAQNVCPQADLSMGYKPIFNTPTFE